MKRRLIQRLGALLIAAAIVFLIVYDVTVGHGFSAWWDKHSITTSLVSDLLIVGATALIFNEVQAYRQRKDRSLTVAAQGLIVYGQAREAYQAVMANLSDPSSGNGVPDELRDLASNLLVASPSLFDDPDARDFLLQKAWSHATIHGLDTRTVDVHIGRLRRKLGNAGQFIITVRNVGFRFDILPEWVTGYSGP